MSDTRNPNPSPEEHLPEDHVQPEDEGQKEFAFLQETIKDEHPSGKRTFYKLVKVAGIGLVFGLAASCGFYALKPWAESKFQKNPSVVTIPKDEVAEVVPEDTGEKSVPALSIDNYRELNMALFDVANAANKSVVEVTGVLAEESWLGSSYDSVNSVSGLFVFDNGQEVLILTHSAILKNATALTVTFCDNQTYPATLKKNDANIGLAVISIPRSSIAQNTWGQIQSAVLGNSNLVARGDAVISLGKQFGFAGGFGYGIISSGRNSVAKADGEFQILNTDIAAVVNGTGVIVNLRGEVIGIIDQSISGADSMNLVTAYAISDIKTIIEDLSNGLGVPYTGIRGVDISETLAKQQGIPQGIYVQEVEADSPAMSAGIKGGDIITRFGKENVLNLGSYQRELLEQKQGASVKIEGQRLGADGYVDIGFEVAIGSKE